MQQRSLLELQGSRGRWPPPRSGAPLWAWLLLGALAGRGAGGLLSEQQEELLELHNHYRGQVAPPAAAMRPLRWDAGLELLAEGYAARCVWGHNAELEDTGENLFVGTGALDLRQALEEWFLEHLDYDFQNNSCDEDQKCGHYTQMVWADTHRVGCAFHLCDNMKGLEWERVSFLVCNYYPAGNYEDERPFVEGPSCSRCPEHLQSCEKNLCVADTVEEEAEEEEEEDEEEVLPTGTHGHAFQPEGEKEEVVLPPPGTSGPSLLPDEEVVDPDVQPATSTSTTSTSITSTTSTSSTSTTSTTSAEEDPDEAPSAPQGKEEKTEEKTEAEERKEPPEQTAGKEEDVTRDTERGAGDPSASSTSLLLAGLTGVLTLRP